jgi:hypothetical protein
MKLLNRALHTALENLCGEARVVHEGEQMVATYSTDRDGRVRVNIIQAGEAYRACCLYCCDTEFLLYVNHRWGVRDRQTGGRFYDLATCYNANCLASEENRYDLIKRTAPYHEAARAGRVRIRGAKAPAPDRPARLPEDFVRLDQLERGHLARRYVHSRGFRPDALAREWGVGYSARDALCLGQGGRLVIPVYRLEQGGGVYAGWQSRAIHEDDERLWKYSTALKFNKWDHLYGLERVKAGAGPVLITEQPADVWRAGRDSVALFGRFAAQEQVRLIRRHFHGRPLVVALDAAEDAANLIDGLREARDQSLLYSDDAPVVRLALPWGREPADCSSEELWALVEQTLRGADPRKHRRR